MNLKTADGFDFTPGMALYTVRVHSGTECSLVRIITDEWRTSLEFTQHATYLLHDFWGKVPLVDCYVQLENALESAFKGVSNKPLKTADDRNFYSCRMLYAVETTRDGYEVKRLCPLVENLHLRFVAEPDCTRVKNCFGQLSAALNHIQEKMRQ